jgi:hypothetical protein
MTTAAELTVRVKYLPRRAKIEDLKTLISTDFALDHSSHLAILSFNTFEDAAQAKTLLRDAAFMGNILR